MTYLKMSIQDIMKELLRFANAMDKLDYSSIHEATNLTKQLRVVNDTLEQHSRSLPPLKLPPSVLERYSIYENDEFIRNNS